MAWSELDLDKAMWLIQPGRMKGGVPHAVPLSPMAVELLRSLPRFSGPFVFTTTGGRGPIKGFGNFKDTVHARIAQLSPPGIPEWRFHDLRRTARTNLSALGVAPFIAELVIGHVQKGVHAVYDLHRYEAEKRDALTRWANKLRSIVEPVPDNVVALRAGA
jgi:integrase